jgi:ABC-type sulfate/molybdate transport systems ATPase subunit
MAFAFKKTDEFPAGSMRITMGTFTNGAGDSGGNISTGLQTVAGLEMQPQGSAVVDDACTVNATFPCADPVAVIATAGADGYWLAMGW